VVNKIKRVLNGADNTHLKYHFNKNNENRNHGGENMIESRCGINCSKCEYRESTGCMGCVNIDKPF
jgi:hypothetical protein